MGLRSLFCLGGWMFLAISGFAVSEPPGPISRLSPFVVSEVMYAPTNRLDARSLQFVEIYNSNPWPEDLSGYCLTVPPGHTLFRFPSNAVLGAQGFVVVAADPGLITAIYDVTNVFGPFLDQLSLVAGVTIKNPFGATMLDGTVPSSIPWPAAANGSGHSLVVAAPSYGNSAQAFSYSAAIGGSPGRAEPAFTDALAGVVINEIVPWPTNGGALIVELYNHRTTAVDLSGCVLADNQGSNFVITAGTILGPGAYAEFLLPANGVVRVLGGEIFLYNAARTRVVDAISFASQPPGRSCGRTPDGSSRWKPLEWPTPGARNSRRRVSQVVISELNFGGQGLTGEFVELYNRGTNDVTIEGWVLDTGKMFVIPPHTTVPANHALVLGGDASVPLPPGTPLLPNFNIGLDNSGERIQLLQPHMFFETNAATGGVTNYKVFIEADVVEYGAGHRLGSGRDYLPASLERQDYYADPEVHDTWIERLPDEAAWDVVSETGLLELGVGVCDALQVMLLGAGEAVVDDIEIIENSGANLLANGTFEGGLGNALARGNHERSFVESGAGFNGSAGLHLRASGRGETGPNNVLFPLAAPLSAGTVITIRAKVRWLKGHPEILFRLKGNYLEAFQRMSKQPGGSLGKPNVTLNLGPEIHEVRHEPVLPAANHPVIATALVDDANGVGTVTLYYRLDPGPAYTPVPMRDDGQAPDAVAGDGVFAAQISGQSANTLVAFYVEATDAAAPPATRIYPLDAPARECLVRFGETSYANAFPSYRVWMTQAARSRWAAREKSSNQPIPVTFVYGTNRVIYDAGARYSGSPEKSQFYDAPDGTLCGYDILLPESEQVLGSDQLILDPPVQDPTLQRQQLMHWFFQKLGLPYNQRSYVNVFVNGVGQKARSGFGAAGTLYEDTQQPNSDLVKQWFRGSSAGSLFKGDDWIEYSTDGTIEHSVSNTLQRFTTTNGELRVARYRWNWRPRSATDSVNEYANLFELVDTLSIGVAAYAECVKGNIDIGNWMRTFAANDLSANLDSFGNVTGRNTYHYHPPLGGWSLFSWDFDVGLGVGGSAVDSPLFDVSDPALLPFFIVPEFTRRYWAALDEALADSFHNGPVDAWLDKRYAVLAAEGAAAPVPIKTFVAQRRPFLESQVSTNRGTWSITSPAAEFSIVSASNYFILSGTAPLSVDTVRVGEDIPPVRWNASNWSAPVALKVGSNVFNIYGVNRLGVLVPGASNRVVIVFNGFLAPRRGNVVLNEIHNLPDIPDTDFIELHNRSSTTAYDLKGGLLVGFVDGPLGSIFPGVQMSFGQPLILPPNGYLLLAGSVHEFCRRFGHLAAPDAEYLGLPGFGAFAPYDLKLWHPLGANPLLMEMISSANYFPGFPWPDEAIGHSLQLIDARSETWRPGNWTVDTNAPPTPRAPNSLRDQLPLFPAVRLNEILPLNTEGIADNAGDTEPWLELHSALQPSTLTGLYLTDSAQEPLRWPFPDGSEVPAGQFRLVWLDGETNETTGIHWHAPFRPSSTGSFVALTRQVQGQRTWIQVADYLRYDLNGSNIPPNLSFGARTNGSRGWRGFVQPHPTPLAPNSYNPAPQEEGVVINEWLASNTRYPDPTDGDFDDWFELYNPTDRTIDLIGYRLSQRATENTKFVIPSGYVIPPHGFLLVWADDDDNDNEPGTDLHVNFKLSRSGDRIYLFGVDGSLQDSVIFGNQIANVSQGRCPDGANSAQSLVTVSLGAPNVCPGGTLPPFVLRLELLPGPTAAISFPRGYNAVIECADNVGSHTWTEISGSSTTGPTETTVYDRTISAGRQRFYRARISGP